MRLVFLLAALTLASCGVDGPPQPPQTQQAPQTSVTITGDGRAGVTGTL